MNEKIQTSQFDFTVDRKNLYREEAINDLKAALIRKLVPVNVDGSEDTTRSPLFVGHTQLMSPQGMVPIQSPIDAASYEEAIEKFPAAMRKALEAVIENMQKMQQQEQMRNREKESSRIIVPR